MAKPAAQIVQEAGIGDRSRRELARESRERTTQALKEAVAALKQPQAAREAEIARTRARVALQTRELESLLSSASHIADSIEKLVRPFRDHELQSQVEQIDRNVRVVESVHRALSK